MPNIPTRIEKTLSEELDFHQMGFYRGADSGYHYDYIKDGIPHVYINRNLIDDTFNVYGNGISNSGDVGFFLNINNSVNSEDVDSYYRSMRKSKISMGESIVNTKLRIPHMLFNSIKFKKVDMFLAGHTNYHDDFYLQENAYIRNFVMPKFRSLNPVLFGSFDNAFKISTVEEIHFEANSKIQYFPDQKHNLLNNEKIFYNNMFLLPRKLDVNNHTKVLFDVYMENESEEDYHFDHTLDSGKLKTSALGSTTLDTYFVATNDDEYYVKNDSGQKYVPKIGEIHVKDYTYYNYSSKKTVKGLSSSAKQGDLVPFNYKGNYMREFEFTPNASMGKVTVLWEENISMPLLDPFDGKYRLSIDNRHDNTILFMNTLSKEYVDSLKSRLKDNSSNYASLNWFERYSNES